jgi:hypothetical protein
LKWASNETYNNIIPCQVKWKIHVDQLPLFQLITKILVKFGLNSDVPKHVSFVSLIIFGKNCDNYFGTE